jgi:hypothetical protein
MKARTLRPLALILATLGLWLTPLAAAALQCGPTEQVLVGLSDRYRESMVAEGAMPNNDRMVVTATENGSTWTLLLVKPDGQTCMMAAGTDYTGTRVLPGVEG